MKYAVIGTPALHSKSPQIYNYLFEKNHLDAYYTRISPVNIRDAEYLIDELELKGVNITAPYKSEIFEAVNSTDMVSLQINSVNTLVCDQSSKSGYNTDYDGIAESLKKNNIDVSGKNVLLLGAGNAARAVAYYLSKMKSSVRIINRSTTKANGIASRFGFDVASYSDLKTIIKETDILISTVPISSEYLSDTDLNEELVVFDSIYNDSYLTRIARQRGCKVIPGEEWLLNQAISSFKVFTGLETDINNINTISANISSTYKKSNIILIGFMGTGKTTIGKRLAERLGYTFIDIDEIIESEEGISIQEIFYSKGVNYFRKKETQVIENFIHVNRAVISTGGGIVELPQNRELLRRTGNVVWLYSSFDNCLNRVDKSSRPVLNQLPDENAIKDIFESRKEHYFLASDLIISNNNQTEVTVSHLYEEIRQTIPGIG